MVIVLVCVVALICGILYARAERRTAPAPQVIRWHQWVEGSDPGDEIADRVLVDEHGQVRYQIHSPEPFAEVIERGGNAYAFRGRLNDGRWLYVAL